MNNVGDGPLAPLSSVGRHLSWVFDGPAPFHSRVSRFLADGRARGQRLIFVADNPRPGQWPTELLESGALKIASTTEVYGGDAVVDATAQRSIFAAELADALELGYTGIRVAADNTSLAVPGERLDAWLQWEQIADEFMSANPVVGLCAFDQQRIDPHALASVQQLHQHTLVN